MKKTIDFILMVGMAIGFYVPCRTMAILERGSKAFGGEVLVPLMVLLVWIFVKDKLAEWEEEEKRV